jgi:hypothetical protein
VASSTTYCSARSEDCVYSCDHQLLRLSFQDVFTKFSWLRPLVDKTGIGIRIRRLLTCCAAAGVAHEIRCIVGDFGLGKICQTDNGKEFQKLVSHSTQRLFPWANCFCAKLEQVLSEFGIQLVHGAAHTPTTQGLVERANGFFKVTIPNGMCPDLTRSECSRYWTKPSTSETSSQTSGTSYFRTFSVSGCVCHSY